MVIFATICTLFVLGSLVGYIIEVFFRRFVSQKRWMNPGFLVGPYLPIYGFGVLGLYGLSELFNFIANNLHWDKWLIIILEIVSIGIVLNVIELITGLIFTKFFKLKLWDYSNRPGNFKGVICPLFAVIWTVVGSLYFFFVHPYLKQGITFLAENTIYYFFAGLILGMILVDFCYSVHLATTIRKQVNNSKLVFNLEKFKVYLGEKRENSKKTSPFLIKSAEIKDKIKEFLEKNKKVK